MYVFAGDGKGGFAASTTLNFKTGKPLTVGSAMHVVTTDWDRDGDVDLVIGNIKGEVWFVPNVGNAKAPEWGPAEMVMAEPAPKPKKGLLDRAAESAIESAAAALGGHLAPTDGRVSAPMGDAGPLVVDWDGDGSHDLLVGCGDGSIHFYRNTAAKGPPKLAVPVALITGRVYGKNRKAKNQGSRPADLGVRVKLAVGDWNGDGRSDLFVGDFVSGDGPAPVLTKEQEAERDKLQKEQEALWTKLAPVYERAQKVADKAVPPPSAGKERSEEDDAKWSELFSKALAEDAEYAALEKKREEIDMKLRPLVPAHLAEGYVWVFLAKATPTR